MHSVFKKKKCKYDMQVLFDFGYKIPDFKWGGVV